MRQSAVLLNVERISKAFKGLQAIDSVTMEVDEGEILGLIGPNGAGKTTLFNLIAGVYRPEKGRILFLGRDVTRAEPHLRCRLGIARTFQLVRPFPNLTLWQNAAVGRVYGHAPLVDQRQARAESLEILEMVGLADKASDQARSLTLVDRKRLELARALATMPRLLLLDELLAGLNPSEVLGALALIRQIRARGISIIMVEHLAKAVFEIADRIVVLSAGEKIAEGSPAAVAGDALVIDAYLGRNHHA